MTYLGDDSLAVEQTPDRWSIRSNPKPIALDGDARRALALELELDEETGEALVVPAAIGAVLPAEHTAVPALIVRPIFHAGGATTITPLSPGAAAELLADQSFNFPAMNSGAAGTAGLRAVAALAGACDAFTLEYGDTADAIDAIRDALETPAIETAVPTNDEVPVDTRRSDRRDRRRGSADLERHDRELHRLSPEATAIWRACTRSPDPAVIAAELSANPGDELRADVERCIDDLVALGLLDTEVVERISAARSRADSGSAASPADRLGPREPTSDTARA